MTSRTGDPKEVGPLSPSLSPRTRNRANIAIAVHFWLSLICPVPSMSLLQHKPIVIDSGFPITGVLDSGRPWCERFPSCMATLA